VFLTITLSIKKNNFKLKKAKEYALKGAIYAGC